MLMERHRQKRLARARARGQNAPLGKIAIVGGYWPACACGKSLKRLGKSPPVRRCTSGQSIYTYVEGNPIGFIDPLGLSKFDQFFGLPKKFWEWAHIVDKKGRGYDYAEDEAKDLYEEWLRLGKPRPDNKGRFRREQGSADTNLLDWLIPWWLTPSSLACSDLHCPNEAKKEDPCQQK